MTSQIMPYNEVKYSIAPTTQTYIHTYVTHKDADTLTYSHARDETSRSDDANAH